MTQPEIFVNERSFHVSFVDPEQCQELYAHPQTSSVLLAVGVYVLKLSLSSNHMYISTFDGIDRLQASGSPEP